MNSLASLQQAFQGSLLNPDRQVLPELVGTKEAPAEERLAVYQEAYRLRLIEALEEGYSGLQALLGVDAFETLCRRYIEAHPSRHWSIRWYGDRMAEFLGRTAPWSAEPCLEEMAAWEWKLSLAFDAPEAESVAEAAVTKIPAEKWPGLTFTFHPSLHRIDLNWTTPRFHQQLTDGEPELTAPERLENPVPWMIWRAGTLQKFRSMEPDEAGALDCARKGDDFAALCGRLCAWHDPAEVAPRAARYLKGWIRDGLVVAVKP